MDIKQASNHRTKKYELFDDCNETKKYDYAKYGILTKSLPKILFKGNQVLTTFLQLIDMRCIMLFKNIDKVKRFKWITWY